MTTPKALVCLLENDDSGNEPLLSQLQTVGFSIVVISWKELNSQRSGLAEIVPALDAEAVQVWILAGPAQAFTRLLRVQVTLVSLALNRRTPPRTAFVYSGPAPDFSIPEATPQVALYKEGAAMAAKLMAVRLKPLPQPELPLYLKAHLDPFVGCWLECGPHNGESWEGFMLGLLHAEPLPRPEIVAFGIGPRGTLPRKSALEYPLKGIEGTYGEHTFTACAAKNLVTHSFSVFLRFEGTPFGLLLGNYPDDEKRDETGHHILFA
jgi:hypothetical protein